MLLTWLYSTLDWSTWGNENTAVGQPDRQMVPGLVSWLTRDISEMSSTQANGLSSTSWQEETRCLQVEFTLQGTNSRTKGSKQQEYYVITVCICSEVPYWLYELLNDRCNVPNKRLSTLSHTQLIHRLLVKVYKRGSGMMWLMVSALLSITLNRKKRPRILSSWRNALYESHGTAGPRWCTTYWNSYCGSRRRGSVGGKKKVSVLERKLHWIAGRETVHQRAWWKPPPLSDNHHFRVSQLRHCSHLMNRCSM